MSGRKKHRTANQFLQYLKGDLSNQERHAFERELEADPFEKEALEGLDMLTPDQAEEDILSLHSRMRKRIGKKRRIAWYSVAASIASLLIVGTIFLQVYDFNPEATEKSLSEEAFSPAPSRSSEGSVPEETASEEVSKEREKLPEGQVESKPGIAEQEAIDGAKLSEDLAKDPSKGLSKGPSKAAEIQVEETPLARPTVAKVPVPEAVAEDAEPEMITYLEAESTPQDKDAHFDYVVSETKAAPKAAPMEEETRLEDTGRRIKRRSELLKRDNNQLISSEVSGVMVTGEDMEADTMTLDEVVVVEQQGNQSGIIRSAQPSVGYSAFKQYIENNIQFPEVETTTKRVIVVLKFTVTSAGEINNYIPLRSSGESFTQEAIRLITEGPTWNPATDDNGNIEEVVLIRIVFKK